MALVAHEAGHAVAGRLVGFRFGILAVGPLCIHKGGRRLSVRWLPPSHWGPFALTYPVTTENLTARTAWCVAGGPIASLLLASVGAILVWLTPEPAIHSVAAPLALTSACVFVATAQPFGTGSGIASDGGRVLALVRNKNDARSAAALVALEGLTEAGIRPRDWDSDLVGLAGQVSTPPAYALSAATALLRHAEDVGDLAEARNQIDRVRSVYPRVPRWLRADAAVEAAFWLAYFQNDASSARAFLRDARGPLVAGHRRLRAEAAVLLRSGDRAGARDALDNATAVLGQGLAAASPLDMELIEAVRRDLAGTSPSPSC